MQPSSDAPPRHLVHRGGSDLRELHSMSITVPCPTLSERVCAGIAHDKQEFQSSGNSLGNERTELGFGRAHVSMALIVAAKPGCRGPGMIRQCVGTSKLGFAIKSNALKAEHHPALNSEGPFPGEAAADRTSARPWAVPIIDVLPSPPPPRRRARPRPTHTLLGTCRVGARRVSSPLKGHLGSGPAPARGPGPRRPWAERRKPTTTTTMRKRQLLTQTRPPPAQTSAASRSSPSGPRQIAAGRTPAGTRRTTPPIP